MSDSDRPFDFPGSPPDWRELLGVPGGDELDPIPTPTAWLQIPAAELTTAWEDLRAWVDQLCARFAHIDHHVIPRCWWRHNEHVEALVALRDHERASFTDTAPATAPVDWFRALRDITALLRSWAAETGCSAAHHPAPAVLRSIDGGDWGRHVAEDAARRTTAQSATTPEAGA